MMYQLVATQILPVHITKAWEFMSNPVNLKTITPDYMGFDIISGAEKRMYQGQVIHYMVTPVAGIKTRWVTEITHVNEPHFFVDEQRFGPYSFWHHKHFLEEIPEGVLMTDIIDYKLPAGIIGKMLHPLLVEPKLKQIFNYRIEKLTAIFDEIEGKRATLIIKQI